jgi:NAD(P)-dependent dehydrogenase (short-subunit alcohol dehydrogenase family)
VSDQHSIEAATGFPELDVLVLCQGAVLYERAEFKMPGFRKVLEVNLMSLMACADKFHDALTAAKGALIIVSSTAAFHSTMMPRRVEFKFELPREDSGKIFKRKLREPFWENTGRSI